ncbi:MAG: sugar phosphate isomerase/epimerase family protein [Planctomycetia bacterium]
MKHIIRLVARAALAACLMSCLVAAEPEKQLVSQAPGLCSYTFRDQFSRDVTATLDMVRAMGITDLEFSNLFGLEAKSLRQLLDERGMVCSSYGVGYDMAVTKPDEVARDAIMLGAKYVRVAWIPHKPPFTAERVREAAADFNRIGRLFRERHGLTFCYHNHGYEFAPHESGTLFDLLMAETNPEDVGIELDILWAHFPGADPAAVIDRYGSRVKLLHLKDLKRGVQGDFSGKTDPDNDVVLGTGQIDIPAVLRAARRAGVAHAYIEDESTAAPAQVPRSIAYLKSLAK